MRGVRFAHVRGIVDPWARRAARAAVRCGPAVVAALALAESAVAQAGSPGTPVSVRKISATSGGFTGPLADGDQFGRAVTVVGDIDGDGNEDLVVGAHGTDAGAVDTGAVWVLFLDARMSILGEQEISATSGGLGPVLSAYDEFGRAVGALGDLDEDGTPDLVVGAALDDDGGMDRGAAWILFLNPDGTVKGEQKISSLAGGAPLGLRNGDQFGRSFARLHDLDGDGVDELAVGGIYDDDGGRDRGAVRILFLQRDGTVKAVQKISSTAGGFTGPLDNLDFFGMSLAALGDLDGDGFDDLAVGAPGDDDGPVVGVLGTVGAVWILSLGADGTVLRSSKISLEAGHFTGNVEPKDWFGYSVANLGDLDGNGVVDLAVGAYGDNDALNPGWLQVGATWILCLDRDASVASWSKISGLTPGIRGRLGTNDWFGSAVAGLGDRTGDGFPDVAIGARFDDDGGTDRGAVYLVGLDGSSREVPLASAWTAVPPRGIAPLEVTFWDATAGAPASWSWDFGDGGTAGVREPTHDFAAPGTYTVSLTTTDAGGTAVSTASAPLYVVAEPVYPFGCGIDPPRSLTLLAGAPRLGRTLVLGVDNPLGTQGPAATILLVSLGIDPHYPCGTIVANMGMTAAGAPGELLVSRAEEDLALVQPGPQWGGVPGQPAAIQVALPVDLSAVGTAYYSQALLVDPIATYGIRRALTNGLEFVLQPE